MHNTPPGLKLTPHSVDSSPACPPCAPQLPMDLWPDIIMQLPSASIESATLVCRYFREFAQPLLFQTLVVKPYSFNPKTLTISPRSNHYHRWISAKLNFCATPKIAASVRACDIGPIAVFTCVLFIHGSQQQKKYSMTQGVSSSTMSSKSLYSFQE